MYPAISASGISSSVPIPASMAAPNDGLSPMHHALSADMSKACSCVRRGGTNIDSLQSLHMVLHQVPRAIARQKAASSSAANRARDRELARILQEITTVHDEALRRGEEPERRINEKVRIPPDLDNGRRVGRYWKNGRLTCWGSKLLDRVAERQTHG